jgi:tRNA 5-methylaminomethyl-2-thiouridine biosynthesis bifunctional protein
MRDGVLFGATHDREDRHADLRPADHVRNLETLRGTLPQLAARVEGRPISGRAAVRATTPDRVPLAGPAPGMEGVFLLSGFGARGFSAAPLLAEHVAALALDAPSPLPAALAALVDPDRFRRRRLRRGAS